MAGVYKIEISESEAGSSRIGLFGNCYANN